MENTTPPTHGTIVFKGANPVKDAAVWITDQTGDPTNAVQVRVMRNGTYTYKVHGEILVRAELYHTTAPGVQVWFNTQYLTA